MHGLQEELFDILWQEGAALCGVGDLTGLVEDGCLYGISVAVPIPPHIVEDLKTAPTLEYRDMYYTLNARLNRIVTAGAEFLKGRGWDARANTTDVVKCDERWASPLPHKTVATRAGLGWIGKSCLLVTKEYGSALRLSSIVTNAPLTPAAPIDESQCGDCQVCVKNCPGSALSGALWHSGLPRERLFQREICKKTQIERMMRATGVEDDLCGLCFAVCPFTQRYLQRSKPA